MRKIIYAFLSLFLCVPSIANVLIPSDAVILAVEKFVPTDKAAAVFSEYTNQLKQSNGAGISAQDLWDVCGTAGWNIQSPDGKAQCESFVNELLKMASVSFYPACDKKYKGKSGYVCVDDFFTNKLYGGTQVNLAPGQTLAQEYARLKHNDSSVLCKSNFDKGVLDYKLMCTSYDQNTYYEFVFDDLEESVDKTIQDSIQTAICKMYDAKPTTAGCTGGGTNIGGSMSCWGPSCATNDATCAKINESMAKFGYTAEYKNRKCEINFNTITRQEDLKTAYDIDNFVFCHGIQVTNAPNVETYLKQYVAERAGVSESSVKCDSGFKTYTGTGCARNGITDFKDDIKTCYVGDNQIDFVFDDINEKWKKTAQGGVQAMSCVVSGGTYSGKRCVGLGEQQCNVLRQSNLTECPECRAAQWDDKTQTCVLPSSASAQNLQRGINITMIIGGAIAGIVITVASVGTATAAVAGAAAATKSAIAFTAIETVGAGIEVAAQLKIDAISDDFLVKSNKCHDATCAKEMLSQNLQRMANLQNDMTDAEADAVDSELARLANLIPDDDDIWATMLVNGTDMADNKAGFWESWEPEQVWRAVGVGLQLASLVTGITKWVVSKSSRIAKSTTAIKQKFNQAVDIVKNATDHSSLTEKQIALANKLDIIDPSKLTGDDIEFYALWKQYAPRNQSFGDFKAMADNDLSKMQEMSKNWISWDDPLGQANTRLQSAEKQLNEFWRTAPDEAMDLYLNNPTEFARQYPEIYRLQEERRQMNDILNDGFYGNYSTVNLEDIKLNREVAKTRKQTNDLYDTAIQVSDQNNKATFEKMKGDYNQSVDNRTIEHYGKTMSQQAIDEVAALRAKQIEEIINSSDYLQDMRANWRYLSDAERLSFAQELSNQLLVKNGVPRNKLPKVVNVSKKKGNYGTFARYMKDGKIVRTEVELDLSQIGDNFSEFMNTLSHEVGGHGVSILNPNAGALGSQLEVATVDLDGVGRNTDGISYYRLEPEEQSAWRIGDLVQEMYRPENPLKSFEDVIIKSINGDGARIIEPFSFNLQKYAHNDLVNLGTDLLEGKVAIELDRTDEIAENLGQISEMLKPLGLKIGTFDSRTFTIGTSEALQTMM